MILKGLGLAGYKGKTIALKAYAKGMDFADALHVYSARGATRFATFDRKLARRALPVGTDREWLEFPSLPSEKSWPG